MTATTVDLTLDAARRIETWLLTSTVQLPDGPHRGGVVGSLDADGRPSFVYLEITGYFLTAMAWLTAGGAVSGDAADAAIARGHEAVRWLERVVGDDRLPPTRLHLGDHGDEWRNAAIFSFDLAMAARGVTNFRAVVGDGHSQNSLGHLCDWLAHVSGDSVPLRSHVRAEGVNAALPDRWSTRPGPHHTKAAAALLEIDEGLVDPGLRRASEETLSYWAAAMSEAPTAPGPHAVLYGVEGLLLAWYAGRTSEASLDVAVHVFDSLVDLQSPDELRSDVIAQALRVGLLLRSEGRISGPAPARRLDQLAAALLLHVRDDGGVLFSLRQNVVNTWSAMFAHQALVLYSLTCASTAIPVAAAGLLI